MKALVYYAYDCPTVPLAAAHLSTVCGRWVKEQEILSLGLKGRLTLSVGFQTMVPGRLVRPLLQEQEPGGTNNNIEFKPVEPNEILSIGGIWDLPMLFSARAYIERLYHTLLGESPRARMIPDGKGVLVSQPNGTWCQLMEQRADHGKTIWRHADSLPVDVFLVVRQTTLDELARSSHALLEAKEPKPTTGEPTRVRSEVAKIHRGTPESLGRKVAAATTAKPIQLPDASSEVGTKPEDFVPFEIADQDLSTKEGRQRAVDAFLRNCNRETPQPIMRKHIWKALKHSSARQFQYWQAMAGPPKETQATNEGVRRILAMSAPDFLILLHRLGHI